MSKVVFCILYFVREKIKQIEICYYINLTSFIGIIDLVEKIWITDLSNLGKVSFEKMDQYNKTALRRLLNIIIFVLSWE